MTTYPNEPSLMRLSRAAASILPKGRSALIRRVAWITGCRRPFLAAVGRQRYLIDLSERVSRTLYLYGNFEPAMTALLPRLLAPGSVMVDAGANFGYFTLLAAASVGTAGKVYAFEPDPRNIDRLLTNLAANGTTNVEHVREGLFDQITTVRFHLAADSEDNLGSSSIVQDGAGRQQIEIAVTTLDHFVSSRNIPAIDLMKMDIEGAELQALAGARATLAQRRIRQVLLELHVGVLGREKAQAILDQFAAAGYHAYGVREDHAVLPATVAEFLLPLSPPFWQNNLNPHLLFTTEPVPGVR